MRIDNQTQAVVINYIYSIAIKTLEEIRLLKEDNTEVFDRIFHEYHRKLYYYVFSKTKSAYYAEEVVQITFIKLWKCRHSLCDNTLLSSQIFRIAKTTLLDHLRQINVSERLMDALKLTHHFSGTNSGYEHVLEKDTQQKIEWLVSEMPPTRRQVFELSRFNGYSHKEIATKLSITVKTVENHINHALRFFRNNLGLLLIALIKVTNHLF